MKQAGTHRRVLISKNLIIMLVLLAVMLLAIWSWFSVHKTVSATGISVSSGLPSEIDVAPVITSTASNGDPIEGPGEFVGELSLPGAKLSKDCTGDGVDLNIPDFKSTRDKQEAKATGKIVNPDGQLTPAISQTESARRVREENLQEAPEYQYIEHQFYVRTTDKTFCMDPTCVLLSKTEANGTSLSTTPAATKKSNYGNFNVDGLVGAMRVSLIGQPANNVVQNWNDGSLITTGTSAPSCTLGTEERQILWVPRPDVYLDVLPTDNDWENWHLLTGIARNSSTQDSAHDVISEKTYKHEYVDSTDNGLEAVTDNAAVCSSGAPNSVGAATLGSTADICHYSSTNVAEPSLLHKTSDLNSESQEYYVYKMTMRIWIEGTDTEARRAMDGGEFNLILKFCR